jgi:hypothetical protein
MSDINPGIYRHYKGKDYEVIGLAHHSETQEELVVYKALYDSPEFGPGALWVRPLKMFTQTVKTNGKTVPRFKSVKPARRAVLD